ncbi:glycosyltransferase family 2 protein [Plantactinospora siamensis]|uniref:4,4'-diaponeurosporenoate glycosyltransferase n=1 Tax=Plantactinospora siamensis TaxID=555372 RepID=A0ABV6P088_9ACTN
MLAGVIRVERSAHPVSRAAVRLAGARGMEESADVVPRFSVVVPCFNEAGYIAATIDSLRAQRFAGGHEIIVVDNNCTDATAAIARDRGATVVSEPEPGVCAARQRGALVARGDIIVSADADTRYGPDWLNRIDRAFAADDRVVAVVGPCRYADGPAWGRGYARVLFGLVGLIYRLTGRVLYATATNIAVRREHFPGYDTRLTQGGDELDLLRRLRRRGRVAFDPGNPSHSSGRRLARGLLYSVFVSLLVHYLAAYLLNRLFGRRVLGAAPAFRTGGTAGVLGAAPTPRTGETADVLGAAPTPRTGETADVLGAAPTPRTGGTAPAGRRPAGRRRVAGAVGATLAGAVAGAVLLMPTALAGDGMSHTYHSIARLVVDAAHPAGHR